ncbi:unnamed protein product [Cyprideis torosa]|uniref:Uncharacterized protein n=1 Tax=Cyprideis torosa TaxID=163714 RepID=A0A7R8ZUM6_9CRUS|nr:unnamed protein product [Cyprideis torosa]CAG0901036.1 unnamed protein product [Cyprideis torosa]
MGYKLTVHLLLLCATVKCVELAVVELGPNGVSKVTRADVAEFPSFLCPPPYELVALNGGVGCYHLEKQIHETWHKAARVCSLLRGGFLLEVDTEEEWRRINMYLQSQHFDLNDLEASLWIGATRGPCPWASWEWHSSGNPVTVFHWNHLSPIPEQERNTSTTIVLKTTNFQMAEERNPRTATYNFICETEPLPANTRTSELVPTPDRDGRRIPEVSVHISVDEDKTPADVTPPAADEVQARILEEPAPIPPVIQEVVPFPVFTEEVLAPVFTEQVLAPVFTEEVTTEPSPAVTETSPVFEESLSVVVVQASPSTPDVSDAPEPSTTSTDVPITTFSPTSELPVVTEPQTSPTTELITETTPTEGTTEPAVEETTIEALAETTAEEQPVSETEPTTTTAVPVKPRERKEPQIAYRALFKDGPVTPSDGSQNYVIDLVNGGFVLQDGDILSTEWELLKPIDASVEARVEVLDMSDHLATSAVELINNSLQVERQLDSRNLSLSLKVPFEAPGPVVIKVNCTKEGIYWVIRKPTLAEDPIEFFSPMFNATCDEVKVIDVLHDESERLPCFNGFVFRAPRTPNEVLSTRIFAKFEIDNTDLDLSKKRIRFDEGFGFILICDISNETTTGININTNDNHILSGFHYYDNGGQIIQDISRDVWDELAEVPWTMKAPSKFNISMTCSDKLGMKWQITQGDTVVEDSLPYVAHRGNHTCKDIGVVEIIFQNEDEKLIWRDIQLLRKFVLTVPPSLSRRRFGTVFTKPQASIP